MDTEMIIYLVFLAIFIISRILKKPKAAGPPPPGEGDQPRRPSKSFEELLEEFTTGQVKEEEVKELPEEQEVVVEDPEKFSGKPTYYTPPLDTSYKGYEGPSGDELRTIDELVEIENVRTRTLLQAEEDAAEAAEEAGSIREMLHNPEDARKAIILSEILNRKY